MLGRRDHFHDLPQRQVRGAGGGPLAKSDSSQVLKTPERHRQVEPPEIRATSSVGAEGDPGRGQALSSCSSLGGPGDGRSMAGSEAPAPAPGPQASSEGAGVRCRGPGAGVGVFSLLGLRQTPDQRGVPLAPLSPSPLCPSPAKSPSRTFRPASPFSGPVAYIFHT